MKTFLEHLQKSVGGTFPIEDIINNLSADEIVEEVKLYALEACKETLKNVRGSLPDVWIRKNHFEFIELKKHLMSEDNIPKELL